MRRYVQATVDHVRHLGAPVYDDEEGDFDPPTHALCGLPVATWSKGFVKVLNWAKLEPSHVCATCDRTALWQSISSLDHE